VTLSFNVDRFALGEAITRSQDMERRLRCRDDHRELLGTAQVFPAVAEGARMLLLAAVIVIYLVLSILYEVSSTRSDSLRTAGAGVGALLTLMLFKMELSVIAIIGVMLVALSKECHLMIDFPLMPSATAPTTSAIHQAAAGFRPIHDATMAAIMGTLPIALGLGAGAELDSFGIAVVAGSDSQLLKLK